MSSELKIAFVSAGGVNFGGPEGPWDHASRLEKIGGIAIAAIVDVDEQRAGEVLAKRKAHPQYGRMYADTRLFRDVKTMLADDKLPKLDAVFIGAPPNCHGSMREPFNMELQFASAGVHQFIEKPISSFPVDEVGATRQEIQNIQLQTETQLQLSVGYMLRYHSAVMKMKELIRDNNWTITNVIARYNCGYTSIFKDSWWDIGRSGGPIIEQATHFVDLARFFAGDAVMKTVNAISVKGHHPAGKLSKMPVKEENIPAERRVPRATTAFWRTENGAICTLHHGVLMHGDYDAEFEIWGDGFKLCLVDPYGNAKLKIVDGANPEQVLHIEDDMYYTEAKAFIDAVRNGGDKETDIQSSYDDAYKTYELTWAIRNACESS